VLAVPASFERAALDEDGVTVVYRSGEQRVECRVRVLVNAAGPWAPQVAHAIDPAIPIPAVDLVQGAHIVVPLVVTQGIYYVENPEDGRAVFIMPWHAGTMIGTTETPYRGEPDRVHALPEEEDYLLKVAARYFPAFRALTRADITQRFAGLRVLPAASEAAFGRSRETIFTTDREPRPRVLGIYGGKLTGWRAAASAVLRKISPSLPPARRVAQTEDLILRRSP